MKLSNSRLYKLVADVVAIVASKERLRQLWGIRLYSNTSYLVMTNLATGLLGFAFWIVVARFYPPEDVGLASALIAATGLVASLSSLGLGDAVVRFLPHSDKDANSMINTVFTLGALTSMAGAVIFVIGLGFWSPALLFIRQNLIYLAAFVLFTITFNVSFLMDRTFVAERRAGFVVTKNLIFGLLKLPLPILLAVFFRSFGIFASWGMSLGVAFLLSMFLFLPRVQPGYRAFFAISRKVVNNIVHFSLANYVADLLWGVPSLVLPIMVVNLLGAEPTAYFYIAWLIGSVPGMIAGAASTSLFAEGSHDEERLGLHIWRSLKMIFLILVPAVILILAIADKLLLLFGGAYSESATTLVRIVAISTVPMSMNVVYLAKLRVEKNLKAILGLTALAAPITLGLAYLLLPRMGINGGGIAWLATQGIIALVVGGILLRRRK